VCKRLDRSLARLSVRLWGLSVGFTAGAAGGGLVHRIFVLKGCRTAGGAGALDRLLDVTFFCASCGCRAHVYV